MSPGSDDRPPPRRYQDLARFALPAGFRGRSALTVQVWDIVQATLFRGSPKIAFGWRRFLLRLFGAKIGRDVLIRPSARIAYPWKVSIGDRSWIGDEAVLYSLAEITIGSDAVISQRSYLCAGAHDPEDPAFTQIGEPITIGAECWLAADVFVAIGVSIGNGTVVGARSTVLHDLPPAMICYGYPARPIRERGAPKK